MDAVMQLDMKRINAGPDMSGKPRTVMTNQHEIGEVVKIVATLRASLSEKEAALCKIRLAVAGLEEGGVQDSLGAALYSTGPCPHEARVKELQADCHQIAEDRFKPIVVQLNVSIRQLEGAVAWACENGNYNPQVSPGDCMDKLNYANNEWWKSELRRRAGVKE